MKPQPPPIHGDDIAKKSRAAKAARREKLTVLYFLLALASTPFVYYVFFDLPLKFYVQTINAQGLDAAAPPLSTIFNMTLQASNRRAPRRCYRHGEAVVRYAGFTVAAGRTRVFCVGARDALDVPVVAWADGVTLPKSLHDRMAAEQRAGSVELEVDVKLFDGMKPTWMWCKVTMRGAEPSDVTPCRVFAPQNWVSDIAPRWMQ
ncbi:hypothetical protein E2562_011545 [Oryza meyeriana var. granulata]|uniref:Late embryogenesis abundant protein LEA-2 subgroup domain-containing protein n=1 Tax=Oryza meyeriana var. granulata TaxID=110450 RepID=A0A6G1DX65_9ORYZ|nr:hypothetical protein E2562_011545 [Oryza meyeriana var. granulata]